MRDGLITDVGADAAIPAGAEVVDGTGLTVYPGLIDMGNTMAIDADSGGGRGGGGDASYDTWAEAERAKRDAILNPDYRAAEHARVEGPAMQGLANAGITSVLAVPTAGVIKGQSALVNTLAAPDPLEISRVGAYRRGGVVLNPAVAQHVSFGARVGGPGFPVSLLGTIAFTRQALSDAMWQKDAAAWAGKHPTERRPEFEPALDALDPVLDGRMPVAYDAGELREILRALDIAKAFKLTPIIEGGIEAAAAVDELKAAHASVILAVSTGTAGGRGGGGGRGGAASSRAAALQRNAPKAAAALDHAGIAYAFASAGLQNPADFRRGVIRAVRDGGLTPDQALRALTINAAKMAGVGDRLGSLEQGKIANVIVTDGDLFDEATRVRRVFIDGYEIAVK
jgi:imidazolonepropionase-like amidohydrolase